MLPSVGGRDLPRAWVGGGGGHGGMGVKEWVPTRSEVYESDHADRAVHSCERYIFFSLSLSVSLR